MAQTTSDPTEPQTIQSTDLRVRTREILEQVKWNGAVYVVTTFGQPSAVIVPEEMFRKWTTALPIPSPQPVNHNDPEPVVGKPEGI